MSPTKRQRKTNKSGQRDQIDGFEYDGLGRMKYHPEFHPNHGKPFTTGELIYLCKFYEYDGALLVGHALGKVPHVINSKVAKLKHQGRFEYYKNMSYEKWESILAAEAGSN